MLSEPPVIRRFVLSHPFHREREKDGARGILGFFGNRQ